VLFEQKPHLLCDAAAIGQDRALLLRFTANNERAQRHLLGAIEQILCSMKDKTKREAMLAKVPRILELFYDADLVEEKQILKWGDKVGGLFFMFVWNLVLI